MEYGPLTNLRFEGVRPDALVGAFDVSLARTLCPEGAKFGVTNDGSTAPGLHRLSMPRHAGEVQNDDDALLQVCGSEQMASKVRVLWTEMMEKQKLDVSDQGLNNDTVQKLIKGLHMCARAA
jgi:hypothetical protein